MESSHIRNDKEMLNCFDFSHVWQIGKPNGWHKSHGHNEAIMRVHFETSKMTL